MASIDLRIENWKKKLLDLGKRNRLINYRETKRSNLKITLPEIDELYRRLVVDEESLEFPYLLDDEDEEFKGDARNTTASGDIQTNRSIKELQKTLRNLRDKAKTAIEEQGVNILYLSFGFLKWKESNDSEQTLASPIVLVPVTLTLESITSPFTLNLHEDEIVLNPTLLHKLDNDFGIKLPGFEGHEDDIIEYLNSINDIAQKNKWTVSYESGLSLLSFLKINMYKDLDYNKDILSVHPIIKALSGDVSGVSSLPEEYNDFNHDEITRPIDTFQVVDADSSQQDAILYSKKGVSFVLQGPPGTGKSQTITNIIAESLAEGKKVLFVSEKMAALEVVHKRLSQAGLADFCLTLHSHKANKKEVLNELGKTLTLNKIKLQDEALYQLELLQVEREKLNRYQTEIHTQCLPLGKSIYEISGRLAKLYEMPDIIFSIENVGGITPEKLNQYIYLLGELSKTIGKMTEDYQSNPWRNCNVPNVSHELRHDIETYLKRLIPKLQNFINEFEETTNELEIELQASLKSAENLIDILEISSKSPKIPVAWVFEDDIEDLSQQAQSFSMLKAEYSGIQDDLLKNYEEGYFSLPAGEIMNSFKISMNEAKQIINQSNYNNDSSIADSLDTMIASLESVKSALITIEHVSENVAKLLGTKNIENIKDTIILERLLEQILSNPKPTTEWFNVDRYKVVKKLFEEVKGVYEQLQLETQKIAARFDKEIFDLEYSAMIKRFKTEYTSFFKIFKKNYRADKNSIRSLSKEVLKKIDDASVVKILNDLKSIAEKKSWINENNDLMTSLFGSHYFKECTDWVEFEKALLNFDKISEYFGTTISNQTKEFLLFADSNAGELRKHYERISNIINSKISDIAGKALFLPDKVENINLVSLKQFVSTALSVLQHLYQEYSKMQKFSIKENSYANVVGDFSKLVRMQDISKQINLHGEKLRSNYEFLFKGIETDWELILKSLTWTSDFRRINEKYKLNDSFIKKICNEDSVVVYTGKKLKIIKDKLDNMQGETDWYISLFDDKDELLNANLHSLQDRIEKCQRNLSALEEWIDFRSCREKCKEVGLADYIGKVEEMSIGQNLILPAFLKRFYRLWLDAVLPKYPSVHTFRRRSHEDVIREFGKLDLTQLSIARSRVRERLVSRLPDINKFTSAVDEVGLLKRELNKQRKIMPLRKLFKAIPNLLLTLKPCLMMSPLSVSLFLEAENYKFNVVIFDEASQVCTEDAVGAIMRGAQVVIAGDSKQLPPTSFFSASTSDNDFDNDEINDDEYYDLEGYESILDEAVTVLPERTLRWHYRSRHEHLIAFSNAKVYNHSLVTFPSHIDKVQDYGVEYIHVPNGVYDRSGKRDNQVEAKKVAEIVFEHFRKYPKRSLGVVTFSEAQQQAVIAAIRRLRLQNQRYEGFFAEDKEEGFFVKNLENVQGDERDTIIFSIGYAKDQNSVMYMNFGPLSRNGGYRRLNVAITRAKFNIKLVGSIHPTDINLENTSAEGVRMLRSYIEFAINGADVLQRELTVPETVNSESPFEEAVYDFLVSKGYHIATQVGCSGYRIDMAVKHPTLSGRFVLGIECDGATYHSARTARERDRLRQTVLEDIGWKIYRIWSTDWIKDPITEGQKLLEAVENAIIEYREYGFSNKCESKNEKSIIQEDTPSDLELQIETVIQEGCDESNPYNFSYYEEANVYEIDRHHDDTIYLANVIKHVVKKEYPIHSELLCKRLACLFGNQKATSKVRNSVRYVFENKLYDELELREDFYWLKCSNRIEVRIPNVENGNRPINYICTEELAEAMFAIVNKSFGILKDDLFVATARVFGFSRTGGNITQALIIACDYLINSNKIKELNGKITM